MVGFAVPEGQREAGGSYGHRIFEGGPSLDGDNGAGHKPHIPDSPSKFSVGPDSADDTGLVLLHFSHIDDGHVGAFLLLKRIKQHKLGMENNMRCQQENNEVGINNCLTCFLWLGNIRENPAGGFMKKNAQLSESLEDYLEVILDLEKENKVARAKDIAQKLGIQPGSVTGGLKSLVEKNLINYEPYSYITLTSEGSRIAKTITRRHRILKDFLLKVLRLDEDTAESAACRMEHAVDETSVERLVDFVEYLFECPRTGDEWIQSFIEYTRSGRKSWEKCAACLEDCRDRHRENRE
jgi:DtxR family Mn-dependent transcriptional regulator